MKLTPSQQAAVDHPAKTLQILACAGSGKTEVLARRVARLLVEGVDPASIVAFTFTDRAAAALKARIEARVMALRPDFVELPPGGRGLFAGTMHGWSLTCLQSLGGVYETCDPLPQEQEWALLLRVARRLGVVDLYAKRGGRAATQVATAPAVSVFLRSAEVVHNERIPPNRLAAVAPEFAGVLERYEGLLHDMRLLPFRLMIGRLADLLPSDHALRENLRRRAKHVFVDEYQDLNRAQDEIVSNLRQLGAQLTVVADDDQAIYQWRGGDVSLFVDFGDRYEGVERITLDENQRSLPGIVEFARPLVEAITVGRVTKRLEAARPRSGNHCVEAAACPDADQEARTIVARIQGLQRSGHRPGDIAVLYRSVRTSAPPILEALREAGIPHEVAGKLSLLGRPEMAFMAHLFVWWAGGSWYPDPDSAPDVVTRDGLRDALRNLTGASAPRAERHIRELEALGDRIRGEGVDDGVDLFNTILAALGLPSPDGIENGREQLGLGQFSSLLADFDLAARRAIPRHFYEAPEPSSVEEAAEDAALATEVAPESIRATVLGAAPGEVYLRRLRSYLEEFVGRAAEETPDGADTHRDAVHIMTVHQAKGLEFPIVFVPGLVEGRFPSSLTGRRQVWHVPESLFDRSRYEGRFEDEQRLLYVALSRARELLVVTWFEHRAAREAPASRFLVRQLKTELRNAGRLGSCSPVAVSNPRHDEEPLETEFSRLSLYSECGYRYWLRCICGFRTRRVPELGFGKLLHHLLAELARVARDRGVVSPSDVDRLLDERFYLPFAGAVPRAKLREAAARRLRRYVRDYGVELFRVIEPERRFEVPLEHARVKGRIDLLLRAPGGNERDVVLVDFKTAENRPPSESHQNQLRLYAKACERLGYRPVELLIHDLDADDGERMVVPWDERAAARFMDDLATWVDGIRSCRFEPVAEQATCARCDFRDFCRFAPPRDRPAGSAGPHRKESGR